MVEIITFLKKELFIFAVMGCIYSNIELIFRGFTSPYMIIVGGICGVLIGLINNIYPNKKLWAQCLIGMFIVTTLEFVSGYILNIKMGLDIWDYSNLPFNYKGQISLLFCIFWFFLSIVAIWLDDYLRYKFYNGKKPNDLSIYIKGLFMGRKYKRFF